MLNRPVDDGIRSIVEHLADNLTAQARITLADLDERWDAVLIDKKMINGPSTGTT
jgi:hypothetical protein